MLIVATTGFVTPMALLMIDRWVADPDVGFDNVARIFPFARTTLVHNLIRKVLFCEYC
jgi:hypothetical protein